MQAEFNFEGRHPNAEFQGWEIARREAQKEWARALKLPVGKRCEVWLKDGVRLEGVLQLAEAKLFVDHCNQGGEALQVDGVRFFYPEMESCTTVEA